MSITPIRRPRYARRSIVYTVQRIANQIAEAHDGKVPDVFQIDAALKREFETHPDMFDLDTFVRDSRKHWERATNEAINRQMGGSVFVPRAFVPVGRRIKGMMQDLDPIADVAAWLEKDEQAKRNFNNTIDWRQGRKLVVIDEATRNRDCKTWGELEAKLRGWKSSPADEIFPADGADTVDEEDVVETV